MMDWMMGWGWLMMLLGGVLCVALIALVTVLVVQLSRGLSKSK